MPAPMFRHDDGITEQANHDAAVAAFADAGGVPGNRTRETRIPRKARPSALSRNGMRQRLIELLAALK